MRDVAFWPRTFLDEIEQAQVGPAPVLWALGGPSFLFRSSRSDDLDRPVLGGTPDDAVADAYRAVAIPGQAGRDPFRGCRHLELTTTSPLS